MLRIDTFISWLISVVVIFFIFYGMILFLPLLLLIVGGYILYQFIRILWIKYQLNKNMYSIDITNEKSGNGKIIDAEFEILDEKMRK